MPTIRVELMEGRTVEQKRALASALVRQQDEAGISTSDRAVERLSRNPVVRAYVDRLWPPLTPAKLLKGLA